jgi:maltodextrin utilization protein YvdJ
VVLLGGTAVLLVLSNQPTILYVLAVVSVVGVLLIVTSLNAVFLLMLVKRDGLARRWQETAVPLLVSFALAVLQLGSITLLRFNFTGTITGFPGLS